MITRRTFLKNSALSVGGLGAATAVMGTIPMPALSKTSTMVGDIKIDVLSDGNLRVPVARNMPGIDETERAEFFKEHQMSMEIREPSCNLTLMRDGKNTILFDVGAGQNFMPSAGKVGAAFEALEVDPSEVTHVVFTHAHPDHIWGLLDDFDEPVFSEAQHMISAKEWDYWMDPETVNTIGEAQQSFAAGAKRNLEAIEEQIIRFDWDKEILPNILSVDSNGHTPGHTSFIVGSGSHQIFITGDSLTSEHISFEKPHWPNGSDHDKQQGIATRKTLLDRLAGDKMPVVGFHLPYPGIGHVDRFEDNYKFVAA